jgi:hypothetical protein
LTRQHGRGGFLPLLAVDDDVIKDRFKFHRLYPDPRERK